MIEPIVLSAFMVGLLGGAHCASMCGGIVSAISFRGVAISVHGARPAPKASFHLAYNAGRVGSYALAGAVAGSIGAVGSHFFDELLPIRTLLYVLASLMLLAQGLYLAGLWRGLVVLERVGGRLWAHLQPWSRRFLPVDSAGKALAVGALWGWLPCGMVYSVLAIALASSDPLTGAVVMLAFGFGTLPNLLAMGMATARLRPLFRDVRFRFAAGALVMVFGVIGLVRALQPVHEHAAPITLHESGAYVHTGH